MNSNFKILAQSKQHHMRSSNNNKKIERKKRVLTCSMILYVLCWSYSLVESVSPSLHPNAEAITKQQYRLGLLFFFYPFFPFDGYTMYSQFFFNSSMVNIQILLTPIMQQLSLSLSLFKFECFSLRIMVFSLGVV